LVIIDVQESFLAAHLPRLQEGVRRAVHRAREQGIHVIAVRFAYCGEIIGPILDLLEEVGYTEVTKDRQSAFSALDPLLDAGDRLLVCGVNTDCCVADTVDDLAEAGYSVHMLGEACASASHLEDPNSIGCKKTFDELFEEYLVDQGCYHRLECERQRWDGRLMALQDIPSAVVA
jgi:nicotinamidase-related amidase